MVYRRGQDRVGDSRARTRERRLGATVRRRGAFSFVYIARLPNGSPARPHDRVVDGALRVPSQRGTMWIVDLPVLGVLTPAERPWVIVQAMEENDAPRACIVALGRASRIASKT